MQVAYKYVEVSPVQIARLFEWLEEKWHRAVEARDLPPEIPKRVVDVVCWFMVFPKIRLMVYGSIVVAAVMTWRGTLFDYYVFRAG